MTSSYQYTPYLWPMVTAIGLAAVVGIYSWRHRSVPGATALFYHRRFKETPGPLADWRRPKNRKDTGDVRSGISTDDVRRSDYGVGRGRNHG